MTYPPARSIRARGAAIIAAASMVAGGCSVGTNDEPIELRGQIPFDLLVSTTTSSTSIPETASKEVTVYLLLALANTTRLVAVPRDVDVAADLPTVLANLFTVRPNGEERPAEDGLTSAIPEGAALLSANVIGDTGLARVNVRGLIGSEGIQGDALRNALAQIVWTATEDPDVDRVLFLNDGTESEALVDGGVLVDGPVTRADYSQVG